MKHKESIQPHEDYGFFSPDSPTRKVWGYATTPLIGIQRATVVEELDPNLIAAVHGTGDNYARLPTRYARTVQYFGTVAFGDSRTITNMADVLVKIHSKAIGVEPVSGNIYDANDPDSQLWILITGWHSVLKAYEMYGPGKLTEAEENQYWAECAIAAELQTCDPADVPRSRDEVRAYFEAWRPKVAASEAAQQMMDHLLDGAKHVLVNATGPMKLARPIANWSLRKGTIASMPQYQRQLGGLRQSRVTDFLIRLYLRLLFAVVNDVGSVKRYAVRHIAPGLLTVIEQHWQGIEPVNPVVLTPTEARERDGFDKPADAHLELRARQAQRVFGDKQAPSAEGLIESQSALGRLA